MLGVLKIICWNSSLVYYSDLVTKSLEVIMDGNRPENPSK